MIPSRTCITCGKRVFLWERSEPYCEACLERAAKDAVRRILDRVDAKAAEKADG